MFRLLVVVTVLFMMTEAYYYINPESMWICQGMINPELQKVPSDHKFPSIRLINVKNIIYFGITGIETPQQTFKVIFNTVSPHIRIYPKSSKKPALYAAHPCSQYNVLPSPPNQYVPDKTTFHIQFIDCNKTDFLSTDIDNVTNIYIENQTFFDYDVHLFRLHTKIPTRKFGDFGLSHYYQRGGIKSVFDNMIQQGLVSSRIFSFYLNRNVSADLGGRLIFGGSDPAYYEGDFTYIPVNVKGLWFLTIDSIKINNDTSHMYIRCERSCVTIIQPNVWKIMGPKKDISIIHQFIGIDAFGRLDCNRISHLPIITFNMGDKPFRLTGKDYMIRHPDNESVCITVFWNMELDRYRGIGWSLGIPFMGRFYTEFDMEKNRVGFALAKNV